MVAFFISYRLVAKNFGPEGVGQYALVKRVTALLVPLLLLGLGMGIPRYIAMSNCREERSAYMKMAFLTIILTGLFLILMNSFREYCAKIFFGNTEYADLMLPLSFLLAGFIFHSLVYSYFRGRLFVIAFNTLRAINMAIIPLMILILCENITIVKLITLSGMATCIVSIVFFMPFIREFFVHVEKSQFKNSSKNLLCYSLPRIPGSFILAGFFSAGPIIAAHFASAKEAGYISVSQRMLNIVATAVTPLGLILLPKISRMIIQKRNDEINQGLNFLTGATIQLSIFVSFQLIILADIIVKYWLGPEFISIIPIMRIASCSIFCYTFFRIVGSILEATKVKPINAINLSVSFGAFLIISGMLLFVIRVFSPIISLTVAFTSGLVFLGMLTHASVRKLYPDEMNQDKKCFLIAISVNILIGGITILAKPFIVSRFHHLIIFEILISATYLSILFLLRMDWLPRIADRMLKSNPG
jgi:O-antigen/teichoic acid export membrane protein